MELGRLGLWTSTLMRLAPRDLGDAASRLESLGFSAVWIPEAFWPDPFAAASLILAETESLVVGTGIANIYARTPQAMSNAASALTGWFPGRFVLGLGVSHRSSVEHTWGGDYSSPLKYMRSYLDALDAAVYEGPEGPSTRVLAALGPKMIELALERSGGVHPYTSTVDHTASSRARLGIGPLLVPEVKVVFETDPDRARSLARRSLPLMLPNYANNVIRSGFDPKAVANVDDEVVDALVGWGDDARIRDHIQAHLDAGADQVAVQVLTADRDPAPTQLWERVASMLA